MNRFSRLGVVLLLAVVTWKGLLGRPWQQVRKTTTVEIVNVKDYNAIRKKGNQSTQKDVETKTPHPPTFFLHIGPKKTGTTTIQCAFQLSKDLLATTSSYRYVGRHGSELSCQDPIPEDLFDADITETSEGIKNLTDEILVQLRQGYSPIYSSERLSTVITNRYDQIGSLQEQPPRTNKNDTRSELLVTLIDTIKKEGYNVKPILGYRRFYQWVPSYYGQKLNVAFDLGNQRGNPDCRISLYSWFNQKSCIGFKDYSTNFHPTQKVSKALEVVLGLDDVILMNQHRPVPEDGGKLLTSFVRQVLPDSERFYEALVKSNKEKTINTGDAKFVEFIHIAHAAMTSDKISSKPQTKPTKKFSTKLKHALINKFDEMEKIFNGEHNFPRICLSDEQQRQLLELSLQYEKEIYPEWFAMEGTEIDHRKGFQDYVNRGKFCNWDAKMMLENEEFQMLVNHVFENVHDS